MPEERYLLIAAYNVIYATDELREVLRENLDAARDRLTEMVASIHDAEGVRTALILDSRNSSLEVDHPFGNKTFEWILCAGGAFGGRCDRKNRGACVESVWCDSGKS